MPAADRAFAFIEIARNLLPGFEPIPVAGRILHSPILYQNTHSEGLAIKGVPFMHLDYQQHTPEAEFDASFWLYAVDRRAGTGGLDGSIPVRRRPTLKRTSRKRDSGVAGRAGGTP